MKCGIGSFGAQKVQILIRWVISVLSGQVIGKVVGQHVTVGISR